MTYISLPMIGLMPALVQSLSSSMAPYITPWSVRARAGMPSSTARCTIAGSWEAPSSRL